MDKLIAPYEPKKKNRFIVTFPKEFDIPSWFVSETERPSLINESNGFELNPITFNFFDPISPSIAQKLVLLMDIMEKSESKTFDYVLELLGPVGDIIEKWEIKECLIKSIDFGKLGYNNDEILKCRMIVHPKKINLLF